MHVGVLGWLGFKLIVAGLLTLGLLGCWFGIVGVGVVYLMFVMMWVCGFVGGPLVSFGLAFAFVC